jgi:hypothetical protein
MLENVTSISKSEIPVVQALQRRPHLSSVIGIGSTREGNIVV